MQLCKVCKLPILDEGYIHEYSFGESLQIELTHSGVCAEEFAERLDEVLCENTGDEKLLTESLEDAFDGYQLL